MSMKFFVPTNPPHPLGETIARNFKGAELAKHGDELADVNLHYGILYGGSDLYARCKAANKTFVHVDHGFWGRSKDLFKADGLFRFSRNSQANSMLRKSIVGDVMRLGEFERLGLVKLRPRRPKKISGITYMPPSDYMRTHWALHAHFDEVNVAGLRMRFPKAFVSVANKSKFDSFSLEGCDLFVSFNSAWMFKCLELGIDVMSTAQTTMWPWSHDMDNMEWHLHREQVFSYMSGRTFSLEECANGVALDHMLANGELA